MKAQLENKNSQLDSLKVLYEMKNGYIEELEKRLGTEKVRQLEAIGYIENAPSKNGYTFKITKRAKRLADGLYGKKSFFDLVSDYYYVKIMGVNFAV